MPTEVETAEQVLDLLVVGLTWIQEKSAERSPNKLNGWLGLSVLRAMGAIGALPEQTCRQVTSKPPRSLCDYAYSRVHLERLSGRSDACGRLYLPSMPRLRELTAESDRLLLVMVHSRAYFGDMLFTPRGYRLIVSDRGREHARAVAERYNPLDRQVFLDAWKEQVRIRRNANSTFIPGRRRR